MILQEYSQRRSALLARMLPASAAIFFAAPQVERNADSCYPYRQNSNFSWLTGFNEPQCVLLLIKQDDSQRCILFNQAKDASAEIWSGRRLGQASAPQTLGVDEALPIDDLEKQLPVLLNGLNVIYHATGEYALADSVLFAALNKLRNGARKNLRAPATLTDWRPWLAEMRLFKSPQEIAVMERAAEISVMAHTRAMQQCRSGMCEFQLEAEIHHEFARHGARFPAYNTIVGGGENACILHYTENASALRDGTLVLVDAGCEWQGYAADITRTFPVNGRFTPAQRALYDIVLAAINHAIAALVPGTSIRAVQEEVIAIMVQGLVKLGILQGDIDKLVQEKAYKRFFMHGLSHWLGMDVHDSGDYGLPDSSRILKAGMVLTVEPGLYIAPDADVPAEWRGTGIRIEDNLLITEQGNRNLTAMVPKEAEAIEALMARKTT